MVQTTVVSPYADYDFYKNVYHGTGIPEDDFIRLEARAEDELDAMTFHRIPNIDSKFMTNELAMNIRKAVCALAEVQSTGETAGAGIGISSESNDGYSISYSQNVQQEISKRMSNAAGKYLADSGLLYRGGGDWHDN
jgi:hypothetical protein